MRSALPAMLIFVSACASHPSLASTTPVVPPTPPVVPAAPKAVQEEVPPPSEAPGLVRSLADEVGPRQAGSPGQALAEAWAVRTMHNMGFANVHTEPVRVHHWERGISVAELAAPVRRPLAVAALGNSVATPPEGIDAEVVDVPSLDALAALPDAAVRGKVVYVHQVMQRTETGAGYSEAFGVREYGASAAGRKGAVAYLLRSIGTDNTRAPHAGALVYAPNAPRIPAAAVSTADGDSLHRLATAATAASPVRVHLVLGCRTLPEVDGANVIGEVPGTGLADEIVLLGAHLDSWDLGMGALDDGAGVAIVLASARRVMQSRPPRRTVRVVLFADEESGQPGARAYVREHRDELPRHVVAIEADSGDGRVRVVRYAGTPSGARVFERAAGLARPYGVRWSDAAVRGGWDVEHLGTAGVPLAALRQDMSRYFDYHHTANDTPAVLDDEALNQVVAVWSLVVGELASASEDLGRATGGAR